MCEFAHVMLACRRHVLCPLFSVGDCIFLVHSNPIQTCANAREMTANHTRALSRSALSLSALSVPILTWDELDAAPYWGCYCGARLGAANKDTYIGFTNDLLQRRRRHRDATEDGRKKQGAKRTARWRGNFELAFFIIGFASKRDALKFEWQWQVTNSTKGRGHLPKKHSYRSVAKRWNDLVDMISRPPPFKRSIDWRTYLKKHPLTVVHVRHVDDTGTGLPWAHELCQGIAPLGCAINEAQIEVGCKTYVYRGVGFIYDPPYFCTRFRGRVSKHESEWVRFQGGEFSVRARTVDSLPPSNN